MSLKIVHLIISHVQCLYSDFLFRIKRFIGFGVGAGVNVLCRYAVSLSYFINLILEFKKWQRLNATSHGKLFWRLFWYRLKNYMYIHLHLFNEFCTLAQSSWTRGLLGVGQWIGRQSWLGGVGISEGNSALF